MNEKKPPAVGDPVRVDVDRALAKARLRRRVSFLGCGCLLVLFALAVIFAFVVYRGTKNLAADFADPAARTEKVLAVLGAESLPEGYHAVLAIDVPLPFEMVVLSDEPWLLEDMEGDGTGPLPTWNGVPGSRLFYYIHVEAADRSSTDPFEREFSSEEKLGQGDLDIQGRRVAWEAHRGSGLRPQGNRHGVFTRLRVDCGDEETRRAVWFHEQDPANEELSGTPADPAALVDFLGHFRLCGAADGDPSVDPSQGG